MVPWWLWLIFAGLAFGFGYDLSENERLNNINKADPTFIGPTQ